MPKIVDHDQRRREIVEIAKGLIIEGGFDSATMRSIAAAAGFANGALKRYFSTKDSIVAATFQSVLEDMESQVRPLDPDQDPAAGLRALVELGLPLDHERVESARVLLALWERGMNNDELAALYVDHMTRWRNLAMECIRAARGLDEDPEAPEVAGPADELIAVSIGANVASVLTPDGALIPRYHAYVEQFMARVLDVPKPRRRRK